MKYIFGNWKMNGTVQEAMTLANSLCSLALPDYIKTAIFPPHLHLYPVQKVITNSLIALGGQDCYTEIKGAYTGNISAEMLKDVGCDYVLVGHSERRQYQQETNVIVKQKAKQAMKAGLIPVVCVGETLAQREEGSYLTIISEQVKTAISDVNHPYIIAYEPVWAIGTGKVPTLEDIIEVHKTIASLVNPATDSAKNKTPILYGGSVNAGNAQAILANEWVDGVLVGGASLDIKAFEMIINSVVK